MPRYLKVEELLSEGPVEVGQLQSGDVIVGREPDGGGIALSSSAVSRNHGVFTKVRSHWLYQDLGSTNGSWINGVQCRPNRWRVVRSGCVMQFADLLVRLTGIGESFNRNQPGAGIGAVGGRSLLVFSGDEFVDEFLIPEYGRALMIGGSHADLALEGDIFEQPSLIIERRGDKICAFSMVKEAEWRVNEAVGAGTMNLSDGDQIQIGNFSIVLNDPSQDNADMNPGRVGPSREWGSETVGAVNSPYSDRAHTKALGGFGRVPVDNEDEIEATMALDPSDMESRIAGADIHPSMRYALGTMRGHTGTGPSSLEDRVILAVGFVLFFIVAGLAMWWMLG